MDPKGELFKINSSGWIYDDKKKFLFRKLRKKIYKNTTAQLK